MTRHFDFTRIHDEFVNYYKALEKGESEYYSWLKALSLDESKPYGSARESFKWAKSMLNYLKEDAENKYYGVLVGLPIRSMNQNVYRERDLIAASLSLKGKHPSLNHKDSFWFNEQSRWGTLTIEDAKYEDGAIEAVLKVPKTAVCPICNGAKMTELIDQQHIVNVSLEGSMEGAFEFTDPPFTLLTSDVLPGIPLARIKPLEKIMESIIGTKPGVKRMKIEAKVKEDMPVYPKPNVKTDTYASDEPISPTATPIADDSQIDTPSDNAQTVMGINPAGPEPVMKQHEHKVCEPCSPELRACVDALIAKGRPEDSAWAICKAQLGENLKEEDTSQPKPEDIRSGPSKSKAPEHSIPDAGSPPSPVSADVVLGTSPVGARSVVAGTPAFEELIEEQVKRIKAETREVTAQAESAKLKEDMDKVEAIWTVKYASLSEEYRKQQAYNQSQEQIIKEQREAIRKEQLRSEDLRVEMRDLKNQFADITSVSNKQGRLVEDLKLENAELNKKYNNSLHTNLELSQKVTKANEEYLELAQQKESTEEKLTQARTNAKKTLKLHI
jgi:hypothetical protein